MTTSEAGRPNFFIIGAPKCGTTAMSRYLADHPDIHMSKRKELHFFNDDLHDPIVRRPWSSEVQYLKEFDAPSGTRIVGEASVFYAYSDVAVSRIREFDTQAKIAFMVRNPVDLVHSFHSQLLFSGQETLRDLRDAWEKRDSREGSALLKYGEVARLGSQLKRVLSTFPKEQVHVTVYDDFRADPATAYADMLHFLDVRPDGRADFPVVNANRGYRWLGLHRIQRQLPNPSGLKRFLGIKRFGIFDRIDAINFKRFERQRMPSDIQTEIARHFTDEVRLLSDLLGRDLMAWVDRP